MPAQPSTRARSASRGAGASRPFGKRAHSEETPRLDADSPWVLGLRELGRRAGSLQQVHRDGTLTERLGLEMIGVEAHTPIEADLQLQSASEGVLVTGTIVAEATGECGRCLAPLHQNVEVDVIELFAYPASLTEETTDEDEIYRVGVTRDGNEAVDVEPVIRDAIVLALPMTPLCRPDCAGLCVDCGLPLAELPAGHGHELLDPRWAGLAAFGTPSGHTSEGDGGPTVEPPVQPTGEPTDHPSDQHRSKES